MIKLIFAVLITICTATFGYTQDIIHFKNGTRAKVKIIHVKNDTIYYLPFYHSKKVKTVTQNKISTIFFKNGMEGISQKKYIAKKKTAKKNTDEKSIAKADSLSHNTTKAISKKKSKSLSIISTVKKPFGIGIDVILQEKGHSFSGISLDFFVSKNLNIGVGYGYFFGKPSFYFNGKIVFNEIRNNWYPVTDLTFTQISNISKIKQELNIENNTDRFNIFIPSIGVEYNDKSGLIFDLKAGAGLLLGDGKYHYNSLALSLRVAGHI